MRTVLSSFLLILMDFVGIFIAVITAYYLRSYLTVVGLNKLEHSLYQYLNFYPIFIIPIILFAYEGIYTNRYDFWHETYLIIKSVILSFLIIFTLLALFKNINSYSRLILVLSFVFVLIIIPVFKIIVKYIMFHTGIWKKPVVVIGKKDNIKDIILKNFYLGYVKAKNIKKTDSCIINSNDLSIKEITNIIDNQISLNRDVMFIPFLNQYNLSTAKMFEIFEKRYNIILLKNRLKSKFRIIIKQFINYLLALILIPILFPLIFIFAILIKIESKGPVFFKQKRVGKNCKPFYIYKFRSMYEDADKILEKILQENPKLKEEWEKNHKLKDDPRITKIGKFLRKTSLDELPQIINILKGEMSFVGPRPITETELEKFYKKDKKYYCMVKPGITGLWQVSGRNNISYIERVKIDKWYVINWSVWLDFVILLKTIKAVFKQDGVY